MSKDQVVALLSRGMPGYLLVWHALFGIGLGLQVFCHPSNGLAPVLAFLWFYAMSAAFIWITVPGLALLTCAFCSFALARWRSRRAVVLVATGMGMLQGAAIVQVLRSIGIGGFGGDDLNANLLIYGGIASWGACFMTGIIYGWAEGRKDDTEDGVDLRLRISARLTRRR
jgi:hypothetical protein